MYNAIIKGLISYLVIASIFLVGTPIIESGFYLYWYHVFYLLFAGYSLLVYHKIDVKILYVILFIIAYSILTYRYAFPDVVKQLVNVTFSIFVFYSFLIHEKFDLEKVFQKYIKVSKAVLLLGYLQVFLFSLKLEKFYFLIFPFLRETNITIRMQSITQEPSFLAFTFVPVIFLSLYNLTHKERFFLSKRWCVLFVVGYILTVSILAYLGIILIILALFFKNFSMKKLSFALFVFMGIFFLSWTVYENLPAIKNRVDDTMYGLTNGIVKNEGYSKVNLSTYALLSNAYVTGQSLRDNFFTGSGLGTYSVIYDEYLPAELKMFYELSNKDASSLALRLLSETGVIGFLLFVFFLFKYRIGARTFFSTDQKFLWIINASIFVMAILLLLRSGDYTANARILFFLIYYYSYQIIKSLNIRAPPLLSDA